MDVLINADRAYLKGLAVTVESLLAHATSPCRIHLALNGIDDRLRSALAAQWRDHPQLARLYIDNLDHVPAAYRGNCHFSRAAYGKVSLPSRFKRCSGRLLLLDPDTIVMCDVCELECVDLGDSILSAADKPGQHGFNSGVLVVNLPNWYAADVEQQMLDSWLADPLVANAEQDLLHRVVPASRIHWIERTWNVIPHAWERDQPAIVHCVGGRKPWHGDYDRTNGVQEIFYAHLDRTFLKGQREVAILGLSSLRRRWNKLRILLEHAA